MSFRNWTPMHDVVAPILLMDKADLVRQGENGWEMRSVASQTYDEWMAVTFAPTAAVLDEMLAAGEIFLDEHGHAHLAPGPWGLDRGGRSPNKE